MNGRGGYDRRLERLEGARKPARSLRVLDPDERAEDLIATGRARPGDTFVMTGVPRGKEWGRDHAERL